MTTTLNESVNRGGAFFREMLIPAPKSSRQMFRLFSLYDKETGIAGLAKRINFEKVSASQLYFSILRRPPETRHLIRRDNMSYDAGKHFCEIL